MFGRSDPCRELHAPSRGPVMTHRLAVSPRRSWRTSLLALLVAIVALCLPALASANEVDAAATAPADTPNDYVVATDPAPADPVPVEPPAAEPVAPVDPVTPPVDAGAPAEPALPPPSVPDSAPVVEVPLLIAPAAPAPVAPELPSAPPGVGVPATPDAITVSPEPVLPVTPVANIGAPDPVVPPPAVRADRPAPETAVPEAGATAPGGIFGRVPGWAAAGSAALAEVTPDAGAALPSLPGSDAGALKAPAAFAISLPIITSEGLLGILASRVSGGDLGVGAATLSGLPQLVGILVLFSFLFAGVARVMTGPAPVSRLRGHRAVVFRPG